VESYKLRKYLPEKSVQFVVEGEAQRYKYNLVAFDGRHNIWRSHLHIRCRSHLSREGVPIVEDNLERNVVDDETTQFLVHTTKRINVDGLFISRGITGVFDSQHGGVRDSRMCRGDMIILQLKKGHKIKHGNDVTCIVCLCVGRKAFFLETEFTNRETIIVAIADSSPIVSFRGREAYEVSEYAIIRFGNNQFV
jgi:hypothetical protein